jgi:hypothetical protein
MPGFVEMFRRVLAARRIAAANVAANQTHPQMNPRPSQFQTLFTAVGGRLDRAYLVEMCAVRCHAILLNS